MNSTASFPAKLDQIKFAQILAAIIGAWLTLASARAQPVYAVNVLGYVDANFVAGSNLIANPLFAGDNTISNLFRNVPDGSFFLSNAVAFTARNSPMFDPLSCPCVHR